jgi:two-component system nitrate/nitrite response regulator NarL
VTSLALIAIVDDHELLVEMLRDAFVARGFRTLTVVPERPEEVVTLLAAAAPDLVLLDLDLGRFGDSTPLIGPLVSHGMRVLVVTGLVDPLRLARALEAGAIGYQSKSDGFAALVLAADRALSATGPLDSDGRSMLLGHLTRHRLRLDKIWAPFQALTVREQHTLRLLCDGRSVRQIAAAWIVSEATVRSHTQRILEKLAVGSQTQAVALALRSGWLNDPKPT